MPKAKPVCMTCTGPVKYGALYCSDECEAASDNGHWDAGRELEAKGFERDGNTPNFYVKDGVRITLESVRDLGMDKALLHHKLACEARSPGNGD